jgi:hypothetical protein
MNLRKSFLHGIRIFVRARDFVYGCSTRSRIIEKFRDKLLYEVSIRNSHPSICVNTNLGFYVRELP